ncbi:MAG TPA: alpha/beta hydrolase [Candidatus Caccousia avistercoris]|nr:alpha/beta hydrolase [Candidatus Caccousia avistercoris]
MALVTRIFPLFLAAALVLGLCACGGLAEPPAASSSSQAESAAVQARSSIAIVYDAGETGGTIPHAAEILQETLGGSALLLAPGAEDADIAGWASGLGLNEESAAPSDGSGNTVASAQVTPDEQQVLYLWEEGNMPAQTEYTVNNGGYSDDPDFRPYLTFFPVPEGVGKKGAVLICPGGAFQFRSDQPEGTDVAEALSSLGYQSFVVDYRLRPYTQQEGALDLARAVRFVRAHASEYGIDGDDIAVMGFSAGGILSGEMLLHFDGTFSGTALDPDYVPDALDEVSADAAACGMIYSFYGRLSVGTTDVELLRSGDLPPTFYCYGTRDPFYRQFLANADAAEEAGVPVERLQLEDMPHGFGASGGWIPAYDAWLTEIFDG